MQGIIFFVSETIQGPQAVDSLAGFPAFFWNLFQKNVCTDVVFDLTALEGPPKTFSAHKMVMSLWSPYLADEFHERNGKTKTGVNIVKLDDVNPEAFETMLKFMYGQSFSCQYLHKVCNLYKVAVKFQVQRLVKKCLKAVNSIPLEVSNVLEILEASKLMHNDRLVDSCLKLLQERTKEVLETYGHSNISPSMLHTLLDLPKLSLASEFELLVWTFAWGNLLDNGHTVYECVRDPLEEFLPKMQLLSLSNEEFAKLCRDYEDAFTKEEALSIFMNINIPGSRPLPYWYDVERPAREFAQPKG